MKMDLVINLFEAFGTNEAERVQIIRAAGFDGFFPLWGGASDVPALVAEGRKIGLSCPSVHAPFGHIRDVWGDDEAKAEAAVAEQIACLEDCARAGVGLMVAHAFIGFKDHTPTEIGLDRFGRIVTAAEKLSVRIAFENTEGIEYLEALLGHFRDCPSVGFCWDSGHEMCYNHSRDLLALYGDRLLCTHLNDNLGIRDRGGEITWLDDLHLLPFDGIADWKYNRERLRKCGFAGPLTFELTTVSKPGRHENDLYAQMSPEIYLAECYKRACRVAAL